MKFLKRCPVLISLPLFILLWAAASHGGWFGKTVLAGPEEVFWRLFSAFRPDPVSGTSIITHATQTILLALSGWAIALLMSAITGAILGSHKILYLAAEPLIEFLRAVPPVLAFPLFLVTFNFGRAAYVTTIIFGCFPIIVLAIARGIQTLDNSRLEILAVYRVSAGVRIFAAVMEILPSAFLGARIAFSMSLIIAVVSEMVFTPRSGIALGSLAKDAEISFDTATFYACILIIGFYGYICNVLLRRVEIWLAGAMHAEDI